jgi:Xaa-Pro aminopeptidase
VDGFLASAPVNRNYLSHFTGSDGLLLVLGDSAQLVTDSRYWTQASKELRDAHLFRQRRGLWLEGAGLVRRAKVRRLGVEAEHLTLSLHKVLAKELPGVELVPLTGSVEALRCVKDAEEKALLRQACRITDQAFAHILQVLKPGVSELKVAAELENSMRQAGAEGPSFDTIVASGPRGALPHGRASERRIKAGDLVVMDFGCKLGQYCSDFTRTVCVGRASALQRKVYGIVQKAQAAACAAIRPGRPCGQVDAVARGIISKAGFGRNFGHGLGHGVGLEVHEEPRLTPGNPALLRAGMAVTVEPGIYLPGRFGVRIEDLVLVSRDGCQNLFTSPRGLIETSKF